MIKLAFALLLLPALAQAQICYDSSTQTPCPTINNAVATSSQIRAASVIAGAPTAASGVTPTGVSAGQVYRTAAGDMCMYDGTKWWKLFSVNILTGIFNGCVF